MAKLRFHIRFPEEKIPEPIIYQIGHEYKVVTSIRRADVRETTGWMDIEFSGETDEIERAIGCCIQVKLVVGRISGKFRGSCRS